jgi:hypothetical protein
MDDADDESKESESERSCSLVVAINWKVARNLMLVRPLINSSSLVLEINGQRKSCPGSGHERDLDCNGIN